MVLQKCVVCGKQFEAQRKSAKYCSTRCKSRHHRDSKRPRYVPEFRPFPPDDLTESEKQAMKEVEAALLMALRAANDLGRLSEAKRVPYQLKAKCSRISSAISEALRLEGF